MYSASVEDCREMKYVAQLLLPQNVWHKLFLPQLELVYSISQSWVPKKEKKKRKMDSKVDKRQKPFF